MVNDIPFAIRFMAEAIINNVQIDSVSKMYFQYSKPNQIAVIIQLDVEFLFCLVDSFASLKNQTAFVVHVILFVMLLHNIYRNLCSNIFVSHRMQCYECCGLIHAFHHAQHSK